MQLLPDIHAVDAVKMIGIDIGCRRFWQPLPGRYISGYQTIPSRGRNIYT